MLFLDLILQEEIKKWLAKCIQGNNVRSNFAIILLGLFHAESKEDCDKHQQFFLQTNSETVNSLCFAWPKSIILFKLERIEEAEELLVNSILEVAQKGEKLNLRFLDSYLCWIRIIQMKFNETQATLYSLVLQSLDPRIFLQSSIKLTFIKKNDKLIEKFLEIQTAALEIQKTNSRVHLHLKLHAIMNLVICLVEGNYHDEARVFLQICLLEFEIKQSKGKIHEDIAKIAKKYLSRQNLQGVQFEIHYLLKHTSKLSDFLLLSCRSKIKSKWRKVAYLPNTLDSVPQKISISTFLATVDCFIGKYTDVDDLLEVIENIPESDAKNYEYILSHFYFWMGMGHYYRKSLETSKQFFEKAKQLSKSEFSIAEKIKKNITHVTIMLQQPKRNSFQNNRNITHLLK